MPNPSAAVLHRGHAGCSPEDILRRATAVPHADAFPTVDELAERFAELERNYPSLMTSRRVGTSRLGEPIRMYTIGAGTKDHLVVGGVHPNEPIGFVTALHLAQTLLTDRALRDSFDVTWHIIPDIDPDGTRLNETWLAKPGDRNLYAQHFYRPAPVEQVEWAFPISYKDFYFDDVLPETQTLMRVLEETKPDLYVSLHNSEIGGVYYYLSRAVPELVDILHEIPRTLGIPLDTGEPESPSLNKFAPAIFGTGTIAEHYEYLLGIGADPTANLQGASSSEYARRYGTLALLAEVPYWTHPAANDDTETDESYDEMLKRTGSDMRSTGEQLTALLTEANPHLTLDTPFLRASRAFIPMIIRRADTDARRAAMSVSARRATVAERFSCQDLVSCFQLRYGGMLMRALDAEIGAGIAPPAIHRLARQLRSLQTQWLQAAAQSERARTIPVAALTGVQFGAILAAATYLTGKSPT